MIPRETLEKLYKSGNSMGDISKKLGKSPHQVVYWMDKHNIPRRSPSEATYIKRNPHGDPFRIKTNLLSEEAYLKGLGLGIFWGEGDKNNRLGIKVGNSSPRLIKKFIEFLTKICGVSREKLYFNLIVFNDSDPNEALKFWVDQLNVSPDRFGKVTVIPPQGKGTYKKKSRYGVLTVACFNVKLKKWFDEQIKLL